MLLRNLIPYREINALNPQINFYLIVAGEFIQVAIFLLRIKNISAYIIGFFAVLSLKQIYEYAKWKDMYDILLLLIGFFKILPWIAFGSVLVSIISILSSSFSGPLSDPLSIFAVFAIPITWVSLRLLARKKDRETKEMLKNILGRMLREPTQRERIFHTQPYRKRQALLAVFGESYNKLLQILGVFYFTFVFSMFLTLSPISLFIIQDYCLIVVAVNASFLFFVLCTYKLRNSALNNQLGQLHFFVIRNPWSQGTKEESRNEILKKLETWKKPFLL